MFDQATLGESQLQCQGWRRAKVGSSQEGPHSQQKSQSEINPTPKLRISFCAWNEKECPRCDKGKTQNKMTQRQTSKPTTDSYLVLNVEIHLLQVRDTVAHPLFSIPRRCQQQGGRHSCGVRTRKMMKLFSSSDDLTAHIKKCVKY